MVDKKARKDLAMKWEKKMEAGRKKAPSEYSYFSLQILRRNLTTDPKTHKDQPPDLFLK